MKKCRTIFVIVIICALSKKCPSSYLLLLCTEYTALYALDYQSDTTNVAHITEGTLKVYENLKSILYPLEYELTPKSEIIYELSINFCRKRKNKLK